MSHHRFSPTRLLPLLALALLTACGSTTTIDEIRSSNEPLQYNEGDRMVVLGRHEAGHYETDLEFVRCVGNQVKAIEEMEVIPEVQFLDALFPWFEPRTAPKSLKRLQVLLERPALRAKLKELNLRYMIWLDGHTDTSNHSGSMSCTIGPGGGGCFGLTSWDKTSFYEALVWDVTQMREMGRVRVDSEGSNYMIGLGAPIPLLAQVKTEACSGMGKQLKTFFEANR